MGIAEAWMNPKVTSYKREDTASKNNTKSSAFIWLSSPDAYNLFCQQGYTPLDHCPEIVTACFKIAQILSSVTIHLMSNTADGDERIINELSRKIDIDPMPTMTRQTWITALVMNMLLYGAGNAIAVPHTKDGYLDYIEPIAASRVMLNPVGMSYTDYEVWIDGSKIYKPDEVLHFVYNPDKTYLWKGRGFEVSLRDLAGSLKQAALTEKAFMTSEYKPSVIVKVDAMVEEFSGPEGRQKLIDEYLHPNQPGAPWIIPAEQFSVEQIKPLSLADLAINDTVTLDKKTVAAILGVPPFVLGVGQYSKEEWNYFIQTTIMNIAKGMAAELTKKLILSPSWYLRFNVRSLMDWDIKTLYEVYGGMSDKGLATGNEVRDQLGMSPIDGLNELRILENYIPTDMIGNQKKLIQENE